MPEQTPDPYHEEMPLRAILAPFPNLVNLQSRNSQGIAKTGLTGWGRIAAVVCGVLSGARGYETLVEWLHDLSVDFWHRGSSRFAR